MRAALLHAPRLAAPRYAVVLRSAGDQHDSLEYRFLRHQFQIVQVACSLQNILGLRHRLLLKHLLDQGVKLDLVLDEGGAVVEAPMPGLKGHYAMLGILEKGYADVRFVARSKGGHSSTPPKHTPIARLSAFVDHVERHPPFKKKFPPPVKDMFAALAPDMAFPFRLLFGNLWLFGQIGRASCRERV